MKRKMMMSSVLVFLIILGLNGAASGNGGPVDPACGAFPDPTSGPWITGYFTVARDQSQCTADNPNCAHYNVHVVLKKKGCPLAKKKELMFSFATPGLGGKDPKNLCSYSGSELLDQFKKKPCASGVEKDFDLTGIPVLTSVTIKKTVHCGTNREMMYGEVKIRVVPKP